MNESENKKISLSSLIFIIISITILSIIIGLVWDYKKESEESKKAVNELEQQLLNVQAVVDDISTNKEIPLSNAEK